MIYTLKDYQFKAVESLFQRFNGQADRLGGYPPYEVRVPEEIFEDCTARIGIPV